jgi:hypothetical protein
MEPPTAIAAVPPTAIVANVPTAKLVEPPVASVAAAPPDLPRSFLWRPAWALFDAFSEALAILRMFVDPHYRMSWSARLIPLVLLAAILTSWVWLPGTAFLHSIPGIAVFATIYDKVVDLILAFFLYKILSREARRYRDVFPHLAGSNRR